MRKVAEKVPEYLEEPRPEKPVSPALNEAVRKSVMDVLGTPDDLHSVQTFNVFDNCWRVNVRRCTDSSRLVKRIEITDTFFLECDEKGGIVSCQSYPKLAKRY